MAHRKTDMSDRADKSKVRKPALDDVWPVHSAGGWPRDLSLDRAAIYGGSVVENRGNSRIRNDEEEI